MLNFHLFIRLLTRSFILLFIVSQMWAADANKMRTEIKHKSRDLEKIQNELATKTKQQEILKEEAAKISSQVEKDESQIDSLEKSLLYTQRRNSEIRDDIAQTQIYFENLQNKLTGTNQSLGQTVSQLYASVYLAGPSTFESVYLNQIVGKQIFDLHTIKQEKQGTASTLVELNDTYSTYRDEILKQEKQIYSIDAQKKNNEFKLKKNKTQRESLMSELAGLQETANELEGLIGILRSQAKSQDAAIEKARLEKQISGIEPIPVHSLDWSFKGEIVKSFGRQKHPELGTPYISNGLTIHSDQREPVLASAEGKVLYVGNFMSYGPMIVLEHEGDWYTVYGNMSQWSVEKGQILSKGAVLGWPGITEKGKFESYFELRFYGKPVNPILWLKKL